MLQIRPFWEMPRLVGLLVIAMVIVITSAIGVFSCEHLI